VEKESQGNQEVSINKGVILLGELMCSGSQPHVEWEWIAHQGKEVAKLWYLRYNPYTM
jgi:hypothetical protein